VVDAARGRGAAGVGDLDGSLGDQIGRPDRAGGLGEEQCG
jgi:hypothetical protein